MTVALIKKLKTLDKETQGVKKRVLTYLKDKKKPLKDRIKFYDELPDCAHNVSTYIFHGTHLDELMQEADIHKYEVVCFYRIFEEYLMTKDKWDKHDKPSKQSYLDMKEADEYGEYLPDWDQFSKTYPKAIEEWFKSGYTHMTYDW